MKKYIAIAFAILGILSVSSCAKFLDYSSKGSPTEDAFFQTDEQAIDAVKSIYARLPQEGFMGREFYWEQAVASDIVWGKTRSFPTLATFEYTGDEGPVAGVFNNAYKEGMNRCNWIISSLLKKQENTELTAVETRSLGEAYFMRAYYHFLIAYRYGTKDLGVPFVAYETVEGGYNNEIPEQQETVMKNYELIIADLQKAEELLPRVEEYDKNNIGRACKQSAVAVMAKVYAYWATWDKAQWPNVITCVNKLENSYGRALHPVFTDLFAPDVSKFFTSEYCWGYPSKGGQNNAGNGSIEFPGVSLEDKGWGKFNGWGQFKPTLDIYEEMAKDNVNGVKNERLAATILEYGDVFPYFGEDREFSSTVNVEAGFQIYKFLQPFAPADPIGAGYVLDNADWPCTLINWPFIRFADCMLLRAEANLVAGNGGAAAKDINKIRERSHLQPISGDATWTDLYHERRCELAFEMANDHAYDCKRWAYAGAPEIKALALNELNNRPRVRHYYNYNYEIKSTYKEVENPQTGEKKKIRAADDKVGYAGDSQKIVRDRILKVVVYGADDESKVWNPDYKTPVIAEYYAWPEPALYEDYTNKLPWNEKFMTFPYPSEQINKSAGKLKNPPSWQ